MRTSFVNAICAWRRSVERAGEYHRPLTLGPARAHSAPHDHANQLYFILAHCALSDNMTMPFTGIGLPCQSDRHAEPAFWLPAPWLQQRANMRSMIGGTAEIA